MPTNKYFEGSGFFCQDPEVIKNYNAHQYCANCGFREGAHSSSECANSFPETDSRVEYRLRHISQDYPNWKGPITVVIDNGLRKFSLISKRK